MELGNKSCYLDNSNKIKYFAPEPLANGAFGPLCDAWDKAVKELKDYRSGGDTKKDILEGYKQKVNDARLAVDSCNQFSISVRGVSQQEYGILRQANIEKEFATLLSIVMSNAEEHSTRKHMRPFESLLNGSHHTDWTWKYGVSNEEWRSWSL